MPDTSSRKLTADQQIARNRLKRRDGYVSNRLVFGTPLTRKVTVEIFLEQMADFMAGKFEVKPPTPPGDLGDVIMQLDPEVLALTILVPMLGAIGRGWEEGKSEEMKAAQQIGRYLHDQAMLHKLDLTDAAAAEEVRLGRKPAWKFLKPEWSIEELVRAGNWMITCAGMIGYFDYDDRGFPAIRPQWQAAIDEIADEMLHRAPVHLPHLSPPPDWTGWHTKYDDGTHANFVSDWQPETKVAIEAAFAEPARFEHADGVNALQRIPLKINLPVLALVKEFAASVKERKAGPSNWPKKVRQQWLRADKATIKYDLVHARYPGDRPFWLSYSCDTRGRLIAHQHLNYSREDHARALFLFANGARLGRIRAGARTSHLEGTREVMHDNIGGYSDIEMLEIHCANCWGRKGTWDDRIAWVRDNRRLIEAISADARGTFNDWVKAGDPFQFVAACLELAAAWADPNFETHLPIGFDGSCSGIQHLSLLVRDEQAGKLVNLVVTDRPNDIYAVVAAYVQDSVNVAGDRWALEYKIEGIGTASLVQLDQEQIESLVTKKSGWSEWKKGKLRPLTKKQTEQLLKSLNAAPVKEGLAQWWRDRFQELLARGHNSGKDLIRSLLKGPVMTFPYSATMLGMAEKISEGYAGLFGGVEPTEPAAHYLAGKVMEGCREVLPRPSAVMGYLRAVVKQLTRRNRVLEWRGPTGFPAANRYHYALTRRITVPCANRSMQFTIAYGRSEKVDPMGARDSVAANYTHSLDAAHLIRVVLGAHAEDIGCLTIHDCVSCLAPNAARFNAIIRREMAMLYARQDHLAALGDFEIERPPYGKLDPLGTHDAEYMFS
jgi:hypothetical protein